MSQDDQFRAPAGWYPDPLGHPQLRWWNNHGWTEQVSAAPEPLVMPEAGFAWKEKEDEAPVVVQAAPVVEVPPAPPKAVAAPALQQLEAPRAAAQVPVAPPVAPAAYTKYAVNVGPLAERVPEPVPVAVKRPVVTTPAPPAYY